jgi:hypothetical protein
MGRLKRIFLQMVAVLNTVEGIVHLIVAGVGFWGCFDLKVFDFRILLPNIENFIFGLFSLLTGIVIAKWTNVKPGFQDQNRIYTNNERQLDTLIDYEPVQPGAAYQKPEFIKTYGFNFRENEDYRTCRQCG